MKKSELKQIIREVIEEVESIRSLNIPVDVLNIPPEVMDLAVKYMKNFAAKNNLTFNLIDLKQFERALAIAASAASSSYEKAPYEIFKELDPQKQVKFLVYVKWYERNK